VHILEYVDAAGDSPYRDWFESLNAQAAAKVTVALTRIELGNLSNVKGVGQGSRNSGSISGQDTGSTSARTATGS
jgi:putative component of toxin-antitoxin plasmid stabilization module